MSVELDTVTQVSGADSIDIVFEEYIRVAIIDSYNGLLAHHSNDNSTHAIALRSGLIRE
jgi:hypothetical protein